MSASCLDHNPGQRCTFYAASAVLWDDRNGTYIPRNILANFTSSDSGIENDERICKLSIVVFESKKLFLPPQTYNGLGISSELNERDVSSDN